MELNFKVATKKDFIYKPTDLRITILDEPIMTVDENGFPILDPAPTQVMIRTECTAYLIDCTIVESRKFLIDKEWLDVFTGFDKTTLNPIVNEEALDVLLGAFNLELDK